MSKQVKQEKPEELDGVLMMAEDEEIRKKSGRVIKKIMLDGLLDMGIPDKRIPSEQRWFHLCQRILDTYGKQITQKEFKYAFGLITSGNFKPKDFAYPTFSFVNMAELLDHYILSRQQKQRKTTGEKREFSRSPEQIRKDAIKWICDDHATIKRGGHIFQPQLRFFFLKDLMILTEDQLNELAAETKPTVLNQRLKKGRRLSTTEVLKIARSKIQQKLVLEFYTEYKDLSPEEFREFISGHILKYDPVTNTFQKRIEI